MPSYSHSDYMKRALALAEDGLGRVAPNPSVGCVVVKGGQIVAEARTQDGGRPHAERFALDMAGDLAQGADVYVSLEPCAHHGKTPPCAQGLIDAGVARVFVACTDSDPRVSGQGIDMLRQAGIEVETGVCEAEALALNVGFFYRFSKKRPFITLKMAMSADGYIAGADGGRLQISGVEAQTYMHRYIRACHDAILVGARTALIDDPLLTTRVEGLNHCPRRFVLGGAAADLLGLQMMQNTGSIEPAMHLSNDDLVADMAYLSGDLGVTRLLVEGGAKVMQSFLLADLWDEIALFTSDHVMVGVGGLQSPDFTLGDKALKETRQFDGDRLDIYTRCA